MTELKKKSVVVIGGGTGIYPTLKGLKHYTDVVVTAIITMADSGGSTGRLRDEFGQLPIGDVRMARTALATEVDNYDELLRELFLYRFAKGEGLSGHNLGNLLLVALTDITGSEADAVKAAARILRIKGSVLPVTRDKIHLTATYDDNVTVEGEHHIDEPPASRYTNRIIKLSTNNKATITPSAQKAIEAADMVVLGPGDLYTSVLANCVVEGVPDALRRTKADFVFVTNLMTSQGQTYGMTASDHVREVVAYTGREPDVVVVNTGTIPADLLEVYTESSQFPVNDDLGNEAYTVVRADLLDTTPVVRKEGDVLQRSLVRGDAEKTARVLHDLLSR